MYAEHFGLNTPVFTDGIAQDERVFRGKRQKSLQTSLVLALTRSDSVAVLSGAPGTGKTTLAASTLRESATKLALGCLAYGPLTPHELLEQLLSEFGFTPYRNSRTERLAIWRQHLAEMSATGTRVCILIENADLLGNDVLAELESLTAADPRGGLGANIVLMARGPIEALDAPELAPLRQRVRLIAPLAPLDVSETEEYLRFRLEQAGGSWDEVADEEAAAWLHRYSGGIVRILDNLTEMCFEFAAVGDEPRISGGLVIEIADNLQLTPFDETLSDIGESTGGQANDSEAETSDEGVSDADADAEPADTGITEDEAMEPHENHADKPDDATAEAGIVILVGDARESEAGGSSDLRQSQDDEPSIPVLDDVVELSTKHTGGLATDSENDTGQPDRDSIPDDFPAAGAQSLADEDREQIALLEAFAESELRELDGLDELMAASATVETASDTPDDATGNGEEPEVSVDQQEDAEEQASGVQPSRSFG